MAPEPLKHGPGEISTLLVRLQDGDRTVEDQLFAAVHSELRKVARRYMRDERPGHTLQATALVNEAYVKLVKQRRPDWKNRAHFFAIASRVMRRILVDHAKARLAGKRGSGNRPLSLDEELLIPDERCQQLSDLDDSLRLLERGNPSVLSDKGLALKSQGVASWDMARPIAVLQLTPEDRSELQRRVRAPTTSQRDGLRARIVLLRGEGLKQKDVAEKLATSVTTVSLWSQRFGRDGFEGLRDKPGRGRKPWLPVEKIQKVITQVTQPPKGRRRWSVRTMAKAVGISHDSVHRIWRQNDLKPHLRRTFKLSQDPEFERKFWDVIGLYLNPPDKALVLCCDEKSQCQALERTQPGLPLGIGHIRTRTHDYIRHGTITLFAALNYLDGKILSRTEARHTHVEWLRFLKQIERETPQDLDLHLIIDNYATHKHAAVKQWLDKHSRFHIHFTPTSSSWLNLVERFFADLTEECVREGSFRGVRQLIKAIEEYMAARNDEPKRYVWRAEGQQILAKIQRARAALAQAVK